MKVSGDGLVAMAAGEAGHPPAIMAGGGAYYWRSAGIQAKAVEPCVT
jgi:hypothetical protein